ncbi:UNVERIFIED_ORG: hypothetical protein ABIB19_002846 [Arthrobacter sp. UYEF10]
MYQARLHTAERLKEAHKIRGARNYPRRALQLAGITIA